MQASDVLDILSEQDIKSSDNLSILCERDVMSFEQDMKLSEQVKKNKTRRSLPGFRTKHIL